MRLRVGACVGSGRYPVAVEPLRIGREAEAGGLRQLEKATRRRAVEKFVARRVEARAVFEHSVLGARGGEQVRRREHAGRAREHVRAVTGAARHDAPHEGKARREAAPLRDVGLQDRERALPQRDIEHLSGHHVLAAGERHRGRLGQPHPRIA